MGLNDRLAVLIEVDMSAEVKLMYEFTKMELVQKLHNLQSIQIQNHIQQNQLVNQPIQLLAVVHQLVLLTEQVPILIILLLLKLQVVILYKLAV